jgi:hypothetical protein
MATMALVLNFLVIVDEIGTGSRRRSRCEALSRKSWRQEPS